MNKLIYFGYGEDNFYFEDKQGKELKVNFKDLEGAGIAIKAENFESNFPKKITLVISNKSDNETIVRVEKKFDDEVKTEFLVLYPNSTKIEPVSFTKEETEEIIELVVATLRKDNSEIDKTSISLELR